MRLFISGPRLLKLQRLLGLMAVVGISDDKWIIRGQMRCDDNDSVLTSPCSPMSGWQLKCLSLTEEYIFVRVQDAA